MKAMDYKIVTYDYYSKWAGIDINSVKNNEVCAVYSDERNMAQFGYTDIFGLYVLRFDNKVIISYGDKMSDKAEKIKSMMSTQMTADEIKKVIFECTGQHPKHNVKYVFSKVPVLASTAGNLTCEDYPLYLDFFKKSNPNCENTDWLKEYFLEMVEENTCCAVFENGVIVSCTDAPGMPYMQDQVQEIGINTLSDFRGKGYAKMACVACAKEIIKNGKCPQWSTTIGNIGSQKLALSVGFEKFCDVFSMAL